MSTNTFKLVRDAVNRIQNSQRNVWQDETFIYLYLFIDVVQNLVLKDLVLTKRI